MVVPAHGGAAPDPLPLRRRVRVRRRRHRNVPGPGSVEVHRGRPNVLEDPGGSDAKVRLVVVAEHDDVATGVVVELQLVAEVHGLDVDAGRGGDDGENPSVEVARLNTRDTMRSGWLRGGYDAAGPQQQREDDAPGSHQLAATSRSWSSRSARARATRERMVPTGTSQIVAASS